MKKQKFDWGLVITILFLIGLWLWFFVGKFYRDTIIDYSILMLLLMGLPLLTTPFSYKKAAPLNNLFMAYLFNCVIVGGFVTFIFIATNYYFADKKETTQSVVVVEYDKLPSKNNGDPGFFVTILQSDSSKKDLFPPKDILTEWYSLTKHDVRLRKGFWGFDVIVW